MITEGDWKVKQCPCGHRSCNKYGTTNGQFYQGCGYSLEDADFICDAKRIYKLAYDIARYSAAVPAALMDDLGEMVAKHGRPE